MSDLNEILCAWLPSAHEATLADTPSGFSGALIRRVNSPQGVYCLRGWPTGDAALPEDRISELHRWLAWLRASGIATLAVPLATADGSTLLTHRGRLWQLEPWLPGTADFHKNPTDLRLRNTCTALARVHLAAERYESTPGGSEWFRRGFGPSPAVRERLARLQLFERQGNAAAATHFIGVDSQQSDLAGRLANILPALARRAAGELQQFGRISVRLHSCLRDVWHDHVLYSGNDVTGIIDPSAARTENVASDLARLLGSLLGDDSARWEMALEAYSSVRALSAEERRLVRALDRSGVVLSAAHWLERMSTATLNDREWRRVQMLAQRALTLALARN